MNTLSKELHSGIVYADDAATVWKDLKERFNKIDGSRIYQLHREICTINQGNSIVANYFTKLILLWDVFDAFVPPPSCNSDKSRTYVDHTTYLRLFTFLMGLNEVYSQARSQILMMNPLPSVTTTYAMIMADESQRKTAETHSSRESLDSKALYAGKGPYQRDTRNFQQQKKNRDQFCDYCKLQGHVKLNCYKLNGYPPDWKFKKKNGSGVDLGGTGQMQGSQINDKPLATQVRYEKDSDVFGLRALSNARYE